MPDITPQQTTLIDFAYRVDLQNGKIIDGFITSTDEKEAKTQLSQHYKTHPEDVVLQDFYSDTLNKYAIDTYHYKLLDAKTQKAYEGHIEAISEHDATYKLKRKYQFDETSLVLQSQTSLNLQDIAYQNTYFGSQLYYDKEAKVIRQSNEAASKELIAALQNEATQTVGVEFKQNDRKSIVQMFSDTFRLLTQKKQKQYKNIFSKEDTSEEEAALINSELSSAERELSKELAIDYRRIIAYEEYLEKEKHGHRDTHIEKLLEIFTNRVTTIRKVLHKIEVNMLMKKFERTDKSQLSMVRGKLDQFEKRIETIELQFQKKHGFSHQKFQQISNNIVEIKNHIRSTRQGNISEKARENAKVLELEKNKQLAGKLEKLFSTLKFKLDEKKEIQKGLKTPEKLNKNARSIKIIQDQLHKLSQHPLLIQFQQHIAHNELVEQFNGIHDAQEKARFLRDIKNEFEQELSNKKRGLPDISKIINATKTVGKLKKKRSVFEIFYKEKVEEMMNDFFSSGLKGFFLTLKNKILKRKEIDIFERKSNDMRKHSMDDKQLKMQSSFKFYLTQEQLEKQQKKEKQILEGAKDTGNILQDFANYLDDFLIEISSVNVKELAIFYRVLAVMIAAGMPLIKALYQIVAQTKNPKLKKAIFRVTKKIEQGASLSKAMEMYPDIFDDSIIGMIKSGEISGMLPTIMKRIALNVEKAKSLQGKVKGAMMYPAVLFVVIVLVVIAVLTFILPQLMPMFEQGDMELPASTQMLINMSDWLTSKGYLLVPAFFLTTAIFKVFVSTYEGKFYWHYVKLHIPIFGQLATKMCLASFARNLNSLVSSGISIIKALHINAEAVGNEVYKMQILGITESVKQGVTIGDSMAGNTLFPHLVTNMVKVGEETAALGEVTEKLADFYEEEVDEMVKNLSTMMEPIILVVLGVVVGYLMMAIMTPLMSVTESVGAG